MLALPDLIAFGILTLCAVCGILGYFGKMKGFDLSDKVDLFYIEPRRIEDVHQSRVRPNTKAAPRDISKSVCGNSRAASKRTSVMGRVRNDNVLQVAKPVHAQIGGSCRNPEFSGMDKPVEHSIPTELYAECRDILTKLGYKSKLDILIRNTFAANAASNPITTAEQFLLAFSSRS